MPRPPKGLIFPGRFFLRRGFALHASGLAPLRNQIPPWVMPFCFDSMVAHLDPEMEGNKAWHPNLKNALTRVVSAK